MSLTVERWKSGTVEVVHGSEELGFGHQEFVRIGRSLG